MVKKWVLKAIVQKVISYLPKRDDLNLWFQRNITKGVYLNDEHFNYKVKHAADHLANFQKSKTYNLDTSLVMEIGTGWYPIVPISFFLAGVRSILSVDLNSYLTKDSLLTTINMFQKKREEGKLDGLFEIDQDRWKILGDIQNNQSLSLEQMCHRIQLQTKICDLSQKGTITETPEFICSNNTFEHIYPSVLKGILENCKSILKSGGMMSHFIDMSDHFAHFDKSITVYNFLKYSAQRWKRIDNDIQPQNRLRFKDFKKIYKELDIPITDEVIWPYDEKLLDNIVVHSEYKDYSKSELAIIHAYLISEIS